MVVAVHVRRALARRPWLYWLGVVAGLAVAAHVLMGRLDALEAERRRWGQTQLVAVATQPVAIGDDLVAVQWRELPLAVVPDDAVTDAADLTAAVARQPVGIGELVVHGDVVAPGVRARIPAGSMAVMIDLAGSTVATLGDPVAASSGGVVLTERGVVVAVGDGSLVVAVPASEAPLVAAAAGAGDVQVLVLP